MKFVYIVFLDLVLQRHNLFGVYILDMLFLIWLVALKIIRVPGVKGIVIEVKLVCAKKKLDKLDIVNFFSYKD